jgi:phage N-6-adenine-methyltransferase
MSPMTGVKAKNHPQQVLAVGPRADVDERATPPEFFAAIHRRFRFTVDAAALPYNAKLKRFWTPEQDGLKQNWGGERVWINPPFSDIEPWVAKAWAEIRDDGVSYLPGGAELVVMLLPANRTELDWWQRLIEPRRDQRGGSSMLSFYRVAFVSGSVATLRFQTLDRRSDAACSYGTGWLGHE